MKKLFAEITLGWHRATRGPLLCALLIVALLCLVLLPGRFDPELIYTGYGLGLFWAFLLLSSLWCGGTAYALDRERHRLALVFSKPIHRFELWWGRWLAVWLPFSCAAVLGCGLTAFRNLPEGRTRCAPNLPDISHAAVDELARLHSLGRVPENIPEARLLRAVQEDLEMRYTELRPGTPLSYTFTLPAELPDAPTAHFRLSGAPFLGAKDALHLAVDVSCETLPVIRLIPNRLFDTGFTLELPQSHLLPGKTLQLTLHRLDQNEAASVIFQAYHDLHLLLPGIPALCNLARFTFILVLSLALTSALGVSLGCSFSLPVTLFTGVLTLLACSISILSPSISAVDSVSSFWAKVSTFISETLAHPFTDLAELNPLHHLLSGEALPLSVIILFCLRLVIPGLLLCSASSLLSTVKDEDH